MAKSLFGKNAVPSAIKAMWEAEEALTLSQRRERYKCGKKFTTVNDIVRWESYKTNTPARDTTTPVSDYKLSEVWFHKYFKLSPPNIYAKWKEDPVINSKVALWAGNITTLEIDAILNAANSSLLGGGGVDGAIHQAAGGKLYDECKLLNGCDTGESKITRGYRLPAKYVIATVGPIGEKPELLRNAYYNSLEVAKKNGIRTFALCGVSTGIYGYPLYAASHIALATVRSWLEKNKKHVDLIVFCTFLPKEVACYESLMPLYFPRSSVIPKRPIPPRNPEEEQEEGEGEEGEKGEGETGEAGEAKDAEAKEAEEVKEAGEVKEGEAKEGETSTQTTTTTTTTAESDKGKVEGKQEGTEAGVQGKEEQEGKKDGDSADVSDLAASLANTKI